MNDLAKLESLYFAALEKRPALERAAFLDEACAGDADLRRQVEKMLAAQANAASFLEAPPSAVAGETAPATATAAADFPGTQIGPYKLLEQIGEGGMGVVYLAEQHEPVKRRVALKIIKPGMDSRQVIVRFEAERQALSLMDHPNIARVLDGGATGAGRPYFVMDLVQGVPITRYCDERRLSVRERLELFLPVCQAIQHAHHKGIIHRDIKPSNILVALYDGAPIPKVIDFGVAKATGPKLTEETMFTQFGQLVGTLEYMSPEQSQFNQLEIDTRSDVYSLGVVLYELLAGATPHDPCRFRAIAFDETLRIIREDEPPNPSARLSSSETLPAIAANRNVAPARLAGLVRGELDWIVMKCLEKDRNRRYESANGLMLELKRHLADEPVQASPPSVSYRLGKLWRRKKRALIMTSLIVLFSLVAAGTAGYALRDRSVRGEYVNREVEAALDEAEQLRGELYAELVDVQRAHRLLSDINQWRTRLQQVQAAEKRADTLAQGAANLLRYNVLAKHSTLKQELKSAEADLKLARRLDEVRLRATALGVTESSLPVIATREYTEVFRDAGADISSDDANAVASRIAASPLRSALVAALDQWAGRTDDGRLRAHLLAIARRADPDPWRDRFRDMDAWNDVRALQNLASQEQATLQSPQVIVNLSACLQRTGGKPVGLLRRALTRYPQDFWLHYYLALYVADPAERLGSFQAALAIRPDAAAVHNDLGVSYSRMKQWTLATFHYRRALEISPDFVLAHLNLGVALRESNQVEESIAHFAHALQLDPKSAKAHAGLGRSLAHKKESRQAIEHYRQALDIDPNDSETHYSLANALVETEQLQEAIAEFQKAIALKSSFAMAHNNLGGAFSRQGDRKAAQAEFQRAIDIDPSLAAAQSNLGNLLFANGDLEGAVAHLMKARDASPNNAKTRKELARAYTARKDFKAAIVELRKVIEIEPRNAIAHYNLGLLHSDDGDLDGAERYYLAALEISPEHAEAHCNLGHVRRKQGRFTEALASLKTGHELGSRRGAEWKQPSATWVSEAQRLVVLDEQLEELFRGESQPADAAQRIRLAWLCQQPYRQLYATAARLYAEGFAADPMLADDPATPRRYHAACAAALSGCGQGKDAGQSDDVARASLRRQALDWLHAELATQRRKLENDPAKVGPAIRLLLQQWQQDSDLSRVRDHAALAQLPPSERDSWQALWKEVAATLAPPEADRSKRE